MKYETNKNLVTILSDITVEGVQHCVDLELYHRAQIHISRRASNPLTLYL